MEKLLSAFSAGSWNSDLGEFVSDDHQRLAEIIHDYNPAMSLLYIPQRDRAGEVSFPFAIKEEQLGAEPVIIRYLTADQMRRPNEILAWLFEGDLRKHRPQDVLARLEAEDLADKLLSLKKLEDETADREDKVAFAVSGGRDRKHTVRLGSGRKVER